VQQIIQAVISCGLFLVAGIVGLFVQSRLSERHRHRDTMDFLRLVVGALVTFLAIVLGLLTASSKSHFDAVAESYRHLAAELVQLDHLLREVGTDDAGMSRADIRNYLAAVIFSTWPDEPAPTGTYERGLVPGQSESAPLSALLGRAEQRLRSLRAGNPSQVELVANTLANFNAFVSARWAVIESGHPTIPVLFYDLMLFWTWLMFLGFGLGAPRNALAVATMTICAVSLASVIYVILELDDPIGGLIAISSAPLREALADMDLP
jgi:hypothetical protein